MKKIIFIVISFSFSVLCFAQQDVNTKQFKKERKRNRLDSLIKQEEEGVIVYKKQTVYGVKLISDGYGFFFEKGYAKSNHQSLLYQVEIDEKKHVKEEKSSSGSIFSSNPYIYGKLNFFYPVKLGVQEQILLGNKANKNGVSISGNFGGGLIIGALRPYQVQVIKSGQSTYVSYYSDSSAFINGPFIGGPSIGTGWDHLKITPGIYVKPALRFDYGRLNEMVDAVEVGIGAELYSQKIPQMLSTTQKQVFFSAYFALEFGKRK